MATFLGAHAGVGRADIRPRIFLPYDHLLANGRVVESRAVIVERKPTPYASSSPVQPLASIRSKWSISDSSAAAGLSSRTSLGSS